tara:strand:- start:1762 stop:3738 length:1977 start_codon:yes stop_codon:yes gene_type:complete
MKWIGKHPVFSDLMIGSVLLTPPDNQYEYELTLPDNDGTAGQVLTTDGNGVLTWTTNSAGGTGVSMTNGVDNRVMTATAAQDITGEADLTFDSETLTIGADDDGEATIQRTTHSDDTGGNLCIKAGNATGTDKAGGRLELKAGLGTGEGSTDSGGDIRFYTAWKGSSGSSQQSGHTYPMFEFQSPTATRNDFIIYQPGVSQSDYFTIRTATHGATDINTVDSAASAADLTFNIDGDIELNGRNFSFHSILSDFKFGYDSSNIHAELSSNTLSIYGTTAKRGDLKLYEDADNGANSILFRPPDSIASDKTITLPDATGTVALTSDVVTYSAATSSALGLLKIADDTEQTVAAESVSATASRTYGIQFNSSDQAVVNVPWTDNNTTYTAGDGLNLSGTEFQAKLKANGGVVIESTRLAVDLGASSITGTLAVGDGGTGATSLTDNAILTGTGTSAITAESNFTYDGATATLNGQLDINGNSYVRWTNSGSHTVRVNNANATGNTTITFPDASGTIALTSQIVSDGWHGSTTRIKILPRDFVANDVGRPLMIEDDNIGSNELFLHSFSSNDAFAYVPIPTGFKATHARIYGSDTSQNFYVYSGLINSKTIIDIATGATAIGTEKALASQLTSTTTNYLLIRVTSDGSTDEIHGGYITIAEV